MEGGNMTLQLTAGCLLSVCLSNSGSVPIAA